MTKQNIADAENTPAANAVAPGVDGAQALRRAVAILKVVASGRYPGVTLEHVTKTMQLSRSTTHRILKCLVEEGLVDQDRGQRRYMIGRLTYELSLSVTRDFHVAAGWNRLVEEVARQTGQTTYLMARSATDAVCIQKVDGRGMLRVIPVEVGQRRPLGVGAGALALLSGVDPGDIEPILRTIKQSLWQFPRVAAETLLKDLQDARNRGFAISRGRVFEQVVGLGFLLPSRGEVPLALSIAAPASTLDERELQRLADLIRTAIVAAAAQHGE
jgi:DNA-binding IclR family transcriptional regulator